MRLKIFLVVFLLLSSPTIFADTLWVIVGGNMFDYANADKYKSICVAGSSYAFKETIGLEKAKAEKSPKYTILGLENKKYSYNLGYMGECQSDFEKKYEAVYDQDHPSIKRVKESFHKERIIKEKILTRSDQSENRAKELFSKNFSENYSLRKTVWKLPNSHSLVQECIKGSFTTGSDRMHGDSYSIALVSESGEAIFLMRSDMAVNFECNCDLDGVTNCANINRVTDYNNDGVLELVFFEIYEEESCADLRVDEVINNKLVMAYHDLLCVDW